MIEVGLIGAAAGIAGALLFISLTGGSVLALPLFAICGLPVAIAGLGWNLLTAIVAAGVAGVIVAGALSPASAAVYVILFAAPILWMCRLSGLSRPGADNGETREHYPIGGILYQGALATACSVIAIGLLGGFDPVATTTEVTDALIFLLSQSRNGAPPPTAAEVEPLARLFVSTAPFILPVNLLFVHVFDMWLAARITDASGRLKRPRERLWTAVLPQQALVVFGVAIPLCFLPGLLGHGAATIVGALGAALALIGLAVIHATTVDNAQRTPILVALYIFAFFFNVILLPLMALVGLAEGFFRLRARHFSGASPNT